MLAASPALAACPLCRQRVAKADLQRVVRPKADAQGAAKRAKRAAGPAAGPAFASKARAVVALVEAAQARDPGTKVLVFSQFAGALNTVRAALTQRGTAHGTLLGSMSRPQRAKVLGDFESSPAGSVLVGKAALQRARSAVRTDWRWAVASLRAAACGLNLTAATEVILTEPCLNKALELQAIGRAHR